LIHTKLDLAGPVAREWLKEPGLKLCTFRLCQRCCRMAGRVQPERILINMLILGFCGRASSIRVFVV